MPRKRPTDLPNFKRPPVSEVVLSIQFASLEDFKSVHVGLFWRVVRSKYPKVSEQAPINPTFETFGARTAISPGVQFATFLSPPMPRYWFEKEGEPWLLQIQQDRIVYNWRQQEPQSVYPHYEAIRDRFAREVDVFSKFLQAEMLGEMRVNQCEVTYVNTIDLPDKDDTHRSLQEITPLWAGNTSCPLPGELEDVLVQTRCVFGDADNKIGRTYVKIQPAIRQSDQRSVFRVEVLARGKPADASIEAALDLLDIERKQVVNTFAAVTTPAMHEIWEKK
jgi:uncharacterized protein (TIGR04255 family)